VLISNYSLFVVTQELVEANQVLSTKEGRSKLNTLSVLNLVRKRINFFFLYKQVDDYEVTKL
jgi:hypothetical protein